MRADSHATLPCQPCFSSPPLIGCCPCQQPGSHPAKREGGGWHIYISLTLPRLRLQSINSSCWTFQMNCIKRVASRKRREERGSGWWGDCGKGSGALGSVGWIGSIRNHSQSGWWPLWPESDTRGPSLNFKSPCIKWRRCACERACVRVCLSASTGRPRQIRYVYHIRLFLTWQSVWR